MSPRYFSDLLHRFELGPHGSCAPRIKELAGPGRITVSPETLKFLEQVGSDGSEVAGEHIPAVCLSIWLSVRFSVFSTCLTAFASALRFKAGDTIFIELT